MVKEDRNVTSRSIADTIGIPKAVVLWILREDLKKRQHLGHSAANIRQFLTQKQVATLKHPSPILARFFSPDYFLFPEVKLQLKGARFDTSEEIQKAVSDQLNKT